MQVMDDFVVQSNRSEEEVAGPPRMLFRTHNFGMINLLEGQREEVELSVDG